ADHTDLVELFGARRLELGVLRRQHDEHPVAGQDVVDEADGALLADGQRRERVGEGDRLSQRQDGQRVGQRTGAQIDGPFDPGEVLDVELDHESSGALGTSIGTLRERSSGGTSGSSTWRKPSSYTAFAASPRTSAPSGITRRNGPCSISSCW